MSKRVLLAATAICLTAVIAACGSSSSSSPTSAGGGGSGGCSVGSAAANQGNANVKLQATDSLTFTPQTATVPVGQVVQWTNTGMTMHTITFDSSSASCLSDPSFTGGATWSVTFSAPGTYSYHCTIHPQMTGTLTVTQS
ncbi:MAG: cupredoxin domain-containing protein [Candidatus Dormibacteraeota bacterium]|nr:cupredoxin domain-containing protein [Candidatus Dormibacteraeota bacterium]